MNMKIEKIIVGLGNPGEEYAGTRHNLGWMALDSFLRENGIKKKFEGGNKSRIQTVNFRGFGILLVKPTTFMNLSGTALEPILRKHDLNTTDMLVVHDDMDLPMGRSKLRHGGGGGGHKGILSIIEHCGDDFTRLKMGIGRPENCSDDDDDIDWVLGKISGVELEIFTAVMPVVAAGIKSWIFDGTARATGSFNTAMNEIFKAFDNSGGAKIDGEGTDG